jgi:hypothetical protein
MNRQIAFLALGMFLAPSLATAADGVAVLTPEHTRLRSSILQAPDSAAAGQAFLELFAKIDRATLELLKDDPEPTIALQARWRLLADKKAPKLSREPQRFIGYVEGRLATAIPQRWELELALQAGCKIETER